MVYLKMVERHRDLLIFCSRSCGSRFNGKVSGISRRKFKECPKCAKEYFGRLKYCDSCTRKRGGDVSSSLDITKSHPFFARVCRDHARRVLNEKGLLVSCKVCKFSAFVEACHIVPVTIKVINHETNLVGLCPNCHWLFDHGKLLIG